MFARTYVTVFFSVFILFLNLIIVVQSGRFKRVINGKEVACGSQPHIASLRNATNGQHLCGATVLSKHFALTAAHCVTHPAEQYIMQLNNLCDKPAQAQVLEVIVHDRFNKSSIAHDIALIRVSLNIDDTSWLNNIALPTLKFGLSGKCMTYGYGQSVRYLKGTSERLLAGQMEIVSLDNCTEALGPFLAPKPEDGMLCAMGDGVDSCQGDSGGPVVCNGVIEAVTSYGMDCAVRGLPGVFTSVAAHVKWIRKITGIR